MKGTVKWFNEKKGYGFIIDENGQEYFVHFSNIKMDGFKVLKEGQSVEFTPSTSEKGLEAKEISVCA